MFLAGFIVMMVYIGAHTQRVEGQDSCSSQQGIYIVEEGAPANVCFTLSNSNLRDDSSVNFFAESRSGIGIVASGDVDYEFENISVSVRESRQLCQTINISSDTIAERTEYFTVSVSLSSAIGRGRILASCPVAIIDQNGGPSDCYEKAVTNVSLSRIVNDSRFCFSGKIQSVAQCQQDLSPNATTAGCTRWNQTSFGSDRAREIIAEEILPNIATADSDCVRDIISAMESLYQADAGESSPAPPRPGFATNCVLTMRNDSDCETSVLLLEQVFLEEAVELMNDLRNRQTGSCAVGLECCDMSQPSPTVTQPDTGAEVVTGIDSERQVSETVLIGAVLGGVFGIVLVGGAVVVTVLVVTCMIVYTSRRKQKASFVGSSSETGNIRAVVYKRQPADTVSNGSVSDPVATPLVIPNHTNDNPPDYEIVVSTEIGSVLTYPRWRRLFAGMIINPNDLQYSVLIGEGAFGKVYRGTLLTSQPGQGSNGATRQDIAVKTLKKASKPEEIEDFIAESAIMLDFNHPNVLRLVGVCFDTEDKLPVIVLPYMENGDLKRFLKSKRSKSSYTSDEAMPEGLSEAVLLGMCKDIAFGMAYLAKCKFVHRDLAARNCMVDSKLRVKVADFGLSRDVYQSDYYRVTHKQRLPVRWMPPESIFDSLFNEKSDVWSYGAVCWEVFKLGRKPYPGLDNPEIPDYISKGNRLSKPHLCPDSLYELMTRTWNDDPKERPTFNQIVEYLTKITPSGQETRPSSGEHEYNSVEDLMEGEEEDVGDVNIYSEVDSPLYKNFPTRPVVVVPPSVPEEYEVPIRTVASTSVQSDKSQDLAIPTEYEVPVSSLPRSGAQKQSSPSSSASRSDRQQQLEESGQGHVYHILEAPTNK